ncbi:serine-rich adhesin for platelets-like [Dermacentor albipictus]|uniref:serine-rich adhesin for platelets-like n=1 Tax=Dermacentor albipictus TaxID=60249 RepID=UPI0038FC2D5B
MAGMAWTLHPALLYEKFGPVLIDLWESGAFRTLFRPVRHLSRTIGAAITPRRFGRHIEQPVREEQSIDSVPTDDVASERANRGLRAVDESMLELSSTQQNELAFQGDIYIRERRAKKQGDRARQVRLARQLLDEADSALQGRRRRGSIIASTSKNPNRGRLRRRHSMSTPSSDVAGAIPLRKVKLAGWSSGSSASTASVTDNELPAAILKDDSLARFKMYKAIDGGRRSVGATPPVRSSPPLRVRRSSTQLYSPESSETSLNGDRAAEHSRPPSELASSTSVSSQNVTPGETEGCSTEGTVASDSSLCLLESGVVADTLKEKKNRKTIGARQARSKDKRLERRRKSAQFTSELPTSSDSLTMTQEGLQQPGNAAFATDQPRRNSCGKPTATIHITSPLIPRAGAEAAESRNQVRDARPVTTAYRDTSRSTSSSEAASTSLLERDDDDVQEPGTPCPHKTCQSTPEEQFQGPFALLVESNLHEEPWNRHKADSRAISAKELDEVPLPTSVHRTPPSTIKRTLTSSAKRASKYSDSFSDQAVIQPRHRKHSHKLQATLEALESSSSSNISVSSPGSFSLSASDLQREIEEHERRKKRVPCMALVVADTIDPDLTSTAVELTSTVTTSAFSSSPQLTAKNTQMTEILGLAKTGGSSSQLDALTSEQLSKYRSKSSTQKKSQYKKCDQKSKKERKKQQSSEDVGTENAANGVKIGTEAFGSERAQYSSAVGKQKKQKEQRQAETNAVAWPSKGAAPEPSQDAVSGPSKLSTLLQAAGSVPKSSKKAFPGKKRGPLYVSTAGTSVLESPTVECTSASFGLRDDDFEKDSISQSISGDVRLRVKASTRRKAAMLWPFGRKPM